MRRYYVILSVLILIISAGLADEAPASTDTGSAPATDTTSGGGGASTTDTSTSSGGGGTTTTGSGSTSSGGGTASTDTSTAGGSGGGGSATGGGGTTTSSGGGGGASTPPTGTEGTGGGEPAPAPTSSETSPPKETPPSGEPPISGGAEGCPQVTAPSCNGQLAPKFDSNGCTTGYDCIEEKRQCQPPPRPSCPDGSRLEANYDVNGCETGYSCTDLQGGEGAKCPQDYKPVCGSNGKTYPNECFAREDGADVARQGKCEEEKQHFCGNYKCEIGEDQYNCHDDCGKPMPKECRVEKDLNGFEQYICEGDYRPVCKDIKYDTDKCYNAGGNPKKSTDPAGCTTIQCEFGSNRERSFNPLQQGPSVCQSKSEIDEISKKCESVGLPVQMSITGENCKTARCGQKEEKMCPEISYEVKESIKSKCDSQGMGVISSFDEKGCKILQCSDERACQRNVPKEAYGACQQEGGELVVKRGEDGCVSFVDCIHRGDENDIYVEEIRDIPSSTELFGIAMKLEELRIEFDKLARQTNDIADYYKSSGSGEEERFRRVSDMFSAAKDKIDEIKTELRDKLQDITTDDLMQVRQDIKYIKDVMIKDIVYLMLSSGNEVKKLAQKSSSDCGTNGACFDRSLRVCKPVRFYPEGDEGPYVDITGLEGNACVMKVTLPEGQGPPAGMVPGINPPYDMTCKLEKYTMGARDPDTDILPYCSGKLMELMKLFPEESRKSSQPTRATQRASQQDFEEQNFEEFKEQEGFCDCTWAAGSREHPKGCPVLCSSYPDQQSCEAQKRNGCAWSFSGAGGFSQQQAGFQQPAAPIRSTKIAQQIEPAGFEQKCPDGICDAFERRNPDACPEDCGFGDASSSSGGGGSEFGGF